MNEDVARNEQRGVKYYKKEFWSTENLKYQTPHFRMQKVGRLIRQLAGGREISLLDVGCGPGTLGSLLPSNVHYHGIDISIPEPAPNLLEVDILQTPIGYRDMKFDFVVAQGLFEYMGEHQSEKFAEIANVLADDGTFVATYQNFDHRQRNIYWPYSNVQPAADFRRDLDRFFTVRRWFAGAHNWGHSHPRRSFVRAPQTRLNVYIPVISQKFATDYIYICSPLRREAALPSPGARLSSS
jgi:SAM-dependent methyltransferase